MNTIQDVDILPADDKKSARKHNYELEGDRPIKLETDNREEDEEKYNDNYLSIKKEEEHLKDNLNYECQRDNKDACMKEIKSEKKESPELYDDEKLIDEPVLNEFKEDPLELKSDIKKEEKDEEFNEHSQDYSNYQHQGCNNDVFKKEAKLEKQESIELYCNTASREEGSGGAFLGEDIMERIYCDICEEYSRVTEFSFRHKLQSFCDSCYCNHLRKSKSEWMDVKYEWYESCKICTNAFNNSLDIIKHDCSCKNVYYCNNCLIMLVYKEEIDKHVRICVSQSSLVDNITSRKSIGKRTGLVERNNSECNLAEDKHCIVRCKGGFVNNIKKKKRYKCSYCDIYYSASYFKVHLCIHSGEKPFPCKICKKSFSRSDHLKDHVRSHTGQKPFSCQSCKKSFRRSCDLSSHQRTHTDKKRFICQSCKKSLSSMDSLKVHQRIHTGEKPYSCKICRKSFSFHNGLKAHLSIHSSKKPYSCKVCKSLFSSSSGLKYHRTRTSH